MTNYEGQPFPEEIRNELLTNLGSCDSHPQITTLPEDLEAHLDEFKALINGFRRRLQEVYEPTIIEINRFYALAHRVVEETTIIDEPSGEELQLFWETTDQQEWLTDDLHERVLDPAIRNRIEEFFELVQNAGEIGLIRAHDGGMLLHNRTE